MKKALVAISGGVDSAATAAIMKERGYECICVTMDLYCLSVTDREDAANTARTLGLSHIVVDFKSDFEKKVISPFIKGYERGETPNPCIECNKYIKFGKLVQLADELGCDVIATGHYARVEKIGERYVLKTAVDMAKDQSYVLYSLSQSVLSRLCLPLGDMTKDEVREKARQLSLAPAHKKESQDICFVEDGDYSAFISKYTGKTYPEGDFVTEDGKVLGRHRGIINYTIGQRKGLGLALAAPMYVKKKDIIKNNVVLCDDKSLYTDTLLARDFNWISYENTPLQEIEVDAKTRYRAPPVSAVVTAMPEGKVKIKFNSPVRAITSGQAVVLYDGQIVVGGGTIE